MRVSNFPVLFRSLLVVLTGGALSLARAEETPGLAVAITPTAATVNAGTNFTFTANTVATDGATYQWQKGVGATNVNITWATNSTLTLTNVQPADYGTYTVILGRAGQSATNQATLDVNGLPLIVSLNPTVSQYVGETAIFNAQIYSTTPLTNGWYFGGVLVTNQQVANVTDGKLTTSSFTLTNIVSTNGGFYTLGTTNASGFTLISPLLVVLDLPSPSLRFGAAVLTNGQVRFPVYFTSHGTETNLNFSVSYDPAVYANPNFEALTFMSLQSGGTISNFYGGIVGDPNRGARSRPLPAAIPVESQIYTTNGPGFLGVNINIAAGYTLDPGEDTNTFGRVTFDLVAGTPNPYAGLVSFTNAPVPLSFAPSYTTTNSTNSVITTNSVIAFTQTPPAFTLFSSPLTFNPQIGAFEQVAEVANPGAFMLDDVFLTIGALGTDSNGRAVIHQNAQGYLLDGTTYVTIGALAPGESRRLTLEYKVPNYSLAGTALPPKLTAYANTPTAFTPPAGSSFDVTSKLSPFSSGGLVTGYLLDFPTRTGYRYYVQYATNQAGFGDTNSFRTSLPAISGTGAIVQWLDNGPPKTATPPTGGLRVYRVLETR